MKTIAYIVLVLLSTLFALLALVWLGFSAAVSELDDIHVIMLFGFPFIIVSSGLASLIAVLGYRKTFWLPGLINALSGIGALVGSSPGIIDIVKLQNVEYEGHQGNNYHSIDLFIMAIVPVVCIVVSWLIYFYRRQKIPKTNPT
jgi:hypothetical protein